MTADGHVPVVPAVRPLNPKVVALGGGHGLFASLSALRRVTRQLTAIVTVADDGGSSGVLRRDFGVLPPGDPPACPQAIAAVATADWVVFGPGSWFTSILPHLMVPELAEALITTPARRVVALNLVPQAGETDGFSPHAHLEVLAEHAPGLTVDVVLADRRAAGGYAAELEKAAGLLGGRLVMTDLAMRDGSPHHDPRRLAGAFAEMFEG